MQGGIQGVGVVSHSSLSDRNSGGVIVQGSGKVVV